MCTCFMTKITLQELCWCIFWILVVQNKSSLSPLKFVQILKIPKKCQFLAEKRFKMVQLHRIRALRVRKWGCRHQNYDPTMMHFGITSICKNCCWVPHSNYTHALQNCKKNRLSTLSEGSIEPHQKATSFFSSQPHIISRFHIICQRLGIQN